MLNSRFNCENYEILPVDSGADSFFEAHWKFRIGESSGLYSEPEVLDKTSRVMAKIFQVIVQEFGEEWMISQPVFAVDADFRRAFLKTCMRKKSFYKEINKDESNEEKNQ
jgi:hypothetical protein